MTHRSEDPESTVGHDPSKRDFVKKAAYVAPAILSMQAYSALAKAGSTNDSPMSPRDKRREEARRRLCELDNRRRRRAGQPPRQC